MREICGKVGASECLRAPTQGEEDAGGHEEAGSPAEVHEEAHPCPPEGGDEIAGGGLNREQGSGKQ